MRVVPLLLIATAASLQTDTMAPAAVAKLIEQELTAARVPGAAIAVVAGETVYAGGFGVADGDNQTAMTPATLLQAGSLTKLFTALAVGATLEERQLPYDTPVGRAMIGLTPRAAEVTFHQLLSQTSGLRDRAGDEGAADEAALAASSRAFGDADFILPPGLVFSYSNLGYALAGAAIEALRKQPYADALADTTLTPLGMTQSVVRPAHALARPHAVGHRLEKTAIVALRTPANDTRIWPAGYLWTNATDVSRALYALLSEGRVKGHRGIRPSVVTRVASAHTPMPNIFVGGHYGYGLMIARDRGIRIYEHGGTMPGYSALLRMAPDRRFGIAVLTNLDNAPLRRIVPTVMARALSLPEDSVPAREESAVSPDELKTLLGRYQNRGTADVAVQNGNVTLSLDGSPPFAVTRIGENRYLARPKPGIAGPEFVLQPAANGAPPYLHFALWAYAKQ
jgi:CubicO group peptidase (beta-lactamase class C family)